MQHVLDIYVGKHYLVFVDESTLMFFDDTMSAEAGYFCHSAACLPEDQYLGVKDEIKRIFQEFHVNSGQSAFEHFKEFKHSSFKRASLKLRRQLVVTLRNILLPRGLFVGGFFTPVRSYILEEIRTDLLGKADEIPNDYLTVLYPSAVKALKQLSRGPGQSGLIARLLNLPVGAIANTLKSLNSSFAVIYDPREKREDKAVRASVEEYMSVFQNLKFQAPGGFGTYLDDNFRGISSDRPSDEEVGLQLADLIAGEVVLFLQANSDLMSFAANKRLVTQTSVEKFGKDSFIQIDGKWYKDGTLIRMPPGLRRRFAEGDKNGSSVFHYFFRALASGILTCYSSWGQPRDLKPFEGIIFDQID